MPLDQLSVFAAAGSAVCLTVAWLFVHLAGLVLFLKAAKDPPPSKRALWAWGLAFAGGFTGPCVILLSVVALFLGLGELRRVRWGESSRTSALPARLAVATSALILVMTVLMVALILGGRALT